MRFELPDNAREAFQFLAIGGGVVLAIRLAIALIVLIASSTDVDPLVAAIANYRNGYVLLAPHTLVVGGMAMIPRVSVAILFIVVSAMITAICGSLISTLISMSAIRGAVLGARIGLILSTGWVIYALLALPPVSVQVTASGLTVVEQHSFFGALSLPFIRNENVINWTDVEVISDLPGKDPNARDNTQAVMVSTSTDRFHIAQLTDASPYDDQGSPNGGQEAEKLIEQLKILQSSTAH